MRVFKKLAAIVLVLFVGVLSSTAALGLGMSDAQDSIVKDVPYAADTANGLGGPYMDAIIVIADKYISMDSRGYFYVSDIKGLYNALKEPVADEIVKSVNAANSFVDGFMKAYPAEDIKVSFSNKAVSYYHKNCDAPFMTVYWWGYDMTMNPHTYSDCAAVIEIRCYFPQIYQNM